MSKTRYVIVNAISKFTHRQESVLLTMKDRPEWQKGFLNLVGGKIENGETIEQAAVRELKEEAGYDAEGEVKVVGEIEAANEHVYCVNAYVDNLLPVKPREGETEYVNWYPWTNLVNDKRLIPSLRVMLPLMMAGIYNWRLYLWDTFMGKEFTYLELKAPGELCPELVENPIVTTILEARNDVHPDGRK